MYGTLEGVIAIVPGANIGEAPVPEESHVTEWLEEASSAIDTALAMAGYVVPVDTAALVSPRLGALANLYGAAYVLRSRGLDTLSGETEMRSEVWLREFWQSLAALVGGNLSGVGVVISPVPVAVTGGRRVRTLQMRRVDGYSRYAEGDTEYGIGEGVTD